MLRQLLNFGRLHFHLISERVAVQFKPARGQDHARVIRDHFARKMDLERGAVRFNCASQHFSPPHLRVDQLQLAAFKDADKSILPMGHEPFALTVISLLRALLIRQ